MRKLVGEIMRKDSKVTVLYRTKCFEKKRKNDERKENITLEKKTF